MSTLSCYTGITPTVGDEENHVDNEFDMFTAGTRTYNVWPFKNMAVGDVVAFKHGEYNLPKAGAAARAYGAHKGWKFATRTRVIEGVEHLLVKRLPDVPREPEEGATARIDRRGARRVVYGYEDLEVGQEKVYIDGSPEARRAVSGIHNRQRETGNRWSTKREVRVIVTEGIRIPTDCMVIRRVE